VLTAFPVLLTVVFCWSMAGTVPSFASPGLDVRSTDEGTPAWKSAWVVSVRQPLWGADAREKFRTVVPPSVTATPAEALVRKPIALAEMPGYEPAGMLANE